MPKSAREYLEERIQGLTYQSEEIYDVAPGQANDFDSWSALKLILHSSTTHMYTSTFSDIDYFTDIYYIDALSGSGVSLYDEEKCFLGSPLLAAKWAREPFSKMYFIEQDPNYCDALRSRLDYAFSNPHIEIDPPKEWEVIQGDANEKMSDIVDEIYERSDGRSGFNYLTFIDNQGMDVYWDTIRELAPKPWGDLLINLPISQAIGRNATRKNSPKLNNFYGEDISKHQIPPGGVKEYMRDLYLQNLADLDRGVQCSANVDGNVGSFEYDVIYATRETDGGSSYVEVVEYVREFIEEVHAGDVDVILDIIEGEQESMDAFMPDDREVKDSIPGDGDNDNVDDDQSGLSDFC